MENTVAAREPQGKAVSPAWLNTRDAEIYSGLSNVTLWKLRKAGKIRAAKVGRAVRYSRASLDDYLEGCAESA